MLSRFTLCPATLRIRPFHSWCPLETPDSRTVQRWSLEVTSVGQTFTAVGPVHINGVVDAPGKLGTKLDLDKEDLAVKTARNPVARDSHVNGVLTFLLKDTHENKLAAKGTSLILHFDDSQGYSYQTSKGVISTKKK